MINRRICSLVTGLAILTVTTVCSADISYGTAPMMAPTASYDNTGFLIGAQGGYADTHWDSYLNMYSTSGVSVKDNGFAARGYVGYKFDTYLSGEMGFLYLPDATVKGNNTDARMENYAVDLFVKGTLPLINKLGVYAKAGGAYLHSSQRGTVLTVNTNDAIQDSSHIGPAFGIGTCYAFTPQFSVDLSWTRYSGDNRFFKSDGTVNDSYQPNPDVVLLGLSYRMPSSFL